MLFIELGVPLIVGLYLQIAGYLAAAPFLPHYAQAAAADAGPPWKRATS